MELYGTWNRAAMNAPGANSSNQYWLNSEMWASNNYTAWVETGLTQGYLAPAGGVGYYQFAAYKSTSGTYTEYSFGSVTQNATVTDEFQISRNATTNKWNVYVNGALWTTPAIGFWTVDVLDVGGEVYASNATAGTFNMFVKGINSAGNRVNLGTQTPSVNSGMNGSSPSNSAWTWSIK